MLIEVVDAQQFRIIALNYCEIDYALKKLLISIYFHRDFTKALNKPTSPLNFSTNIYLHVMTFCKVLFSPSLLIFLMYLQKHCILICLLKSEIFCWAGFLTKLEYSKVIQIMCLKSANKWKFVMKFLQPGNRLPLGSKE